jgi:hypothetical protein
MSSNLGAALIVSQPDQAFWANLLRSVSHCQLAFSSMALLAPVTTGSKGGFGLEA